MCYFALGDKQGDLHTPAIAKSLCNTDTKRNKDEGEWACLPCPDSKPFCTLPKQSRYLLRSEMADN